MRPIDLIVIHCSASSNDDALFRGSPGTPGFQTPVQVIDSWHAKRGFRRTSVLRQTFNPQLQSIGYHFVLYRNGSIAAARHLDEVGAHVQGSNLRSIGLCLIGTDRFTREQWDSLAGLVGSLRVQFPGAQVIGHRELTQHKTCPGFDVPAWLAGGMKPLADAMPLETR
jgi:N-acetyl-anhydromuramyl-L-alanine amidase AmpD